MTDLNVGKNTDSAKPAKDIFLQGVSSAEVESLPPETRTIMSVMAGFFRSSSGPDPETARIMAEAEMHEESCKLEGFKHAMTTRDAQSDRDHEFRKIKQKDDNRRKTILLYTAILGVLIGLYLVVKLKETNVGGPILVASFLSLGIKVPVGSDKE